MTPKHPNKPNGLPVLTAELVKIVDEIFAHTQWCGYIDLGPNADLWSRHALLDPQMPPPFRPKRFRDRYQEAPYWITFVGGRASIPVRVHNYAMVIRTLRETSLDWAAYGGHVLIARALIEMGDDVNLVGRAGHIPLHSAIEYGNDEMVELLLAHGADPNFPDNLGQTPLHAAAISGVMQIATLLLCAGASPSILDDQGESARDLALQAENHKLAQLFGRVVSQQQASALRRLTLPITGVSGGAWEPSIKRRL